MRDEVVYWRVFVRLKPPHSCEFLETQVPADRRLHSDFVRSWSVE